LDEALKKMEKIIITCPVTGGGTLPTQAPYLPITPEQIANEAVKANKAGAAIVHIHVRNPHNGRPTSNIAIWREALTKIKEKSEVVVNTTTGGAIGMTTMERIRVVNVFEPEIASLNAGSLNIGRWTWLRKIKEFKYAWERETVERTKDSIFSNTFGDIIRFVEIMYKRKTLPELECYDIGHLYNLKLLLNHGILKHPLYIQFVLGYLGGIAASAENLLYMKQTADKLFGEEKYYWTVACIGWRIFPLGSIAAYLGGNVRVGMEDTVRIRRGEYAKSNADLVTKMRRILEDTLDREIATSEEVREIFELKGKDAVKF